MASKILIAIYSYEFYYDVWLHGRYTFKIEKLHEQYGPVIRITPHSLHVSDPDFYEELYSGSARIRDKWPRTTERMGFEKSAFGTANHNLHRTRRAALSPYFSKTSVRRLQPVIDEKLDLLLGRLSDFKGTDEVIQATHIFAAFTNGTLCAVSEASSMVANLVQMW
jgi:cytochrome P450